MGLALILDNIIVFVYRVLRMRIAEHQSRHWPMRPGIVEARWAERGSYSYASVNYSYYVDGQRHIGTFTKPFWASSTAYDFARNVIIPSGLTVRYNPENPADSVVRVPDQ